MMETACCTLHVRSLKQALYFYEGLLGFEMCKRRPQLNYPGAWYELGEMILEVAEQKGAIAHTEVTISGMDDTSIKRRLDHFGIAYTMEAQALLLSDPEGHLLRFVRA
ncbi:lactoylglutathione lyase [Fictibacillus macauensis ZFHKF-1]|uniref:Lactoylglutathione lyase n=1 Tax=Fictibacillus macauensis ZFHKF-1 TaxID=1196324 RepID=I8J1C7_9BACL|nr:hypothetical protein [Fictibacillus macauensis]EIT85531.1 lactoylglutathione lyase [Fictibacillus macauensis ZFHKF-1]